MHKDSYTLALEWETANFDRAMQLNDMLDACPDMSAKRDLYDAFSEEEKRGVMPEYRRRQIDKEGPVGSLVTSATFHGFSITQRIGKNTSCARYRGLALVLGSAGHGELTRYVMLLPPWKNREGDVIIFAEASSNQLKVVGDNPGEF